MKWTVRPADKSPGKAAFALCAVLFAGVCGALVVSLLGGLLSLFVMFFAVGEFFLPTVYEINEKGASSSCLLRKTEVEWSAVRKVYVDKAGLKLSTLGYRTRLEAFRGLYLVFGDEDPEKIKDFVRKHAGLSEQSPE